jgi:hypothetical protein
MGGPEEFEVLSSKFLVSEKKTQEADAEIGGPGKTQEHRQECLYHEEKRDSSRKERAMEKRSSLRSE